MLKEFVAAYGPLAIMLEDLHHFDSISWQFLTTVVENVSDQVLVVTTMRPDDGVLAAASRHEEGEFMGPHAHACAVLIIVAVRYRGQGMPASLLPCRQSFDEEACLVMSVQMDVL